jgi:hypothetical protein
MMLRPNGAELCRMLVTPTAMQLCVVDAVQTFIMVADLQCCDCVTAAAAAAAGCVHYPCNRQNPISALTALCCSVLRVSMYVNAGRAAAAPGVARPCEHVTQACRLRQQHAGSRCSGASTRSSSRPSSGGSSSCWQPGQARQACQQQLGWWRRDASSSDCSRCRGSSRQHDSWR